MPEDGFQVHGPSQQKNLVIAGIKIRERRTFIKNYKKSGVEKNESILPESPDNRSFGRTG